MKLRNKKTGEIKKMWKDNICLSFGDCNKVYYSLKELNEEWEDYATPEPLIKDEKIRKAVRAWAVAEGEDRYYGQDDTTLYNGTGDHIEFWSRPFKDLTPYKRYTIAELCGEEKE